MVLIREVHMITLPIASLKGMVIELGGYLTTTGSIKTGGWVGSVLVPLVVLGTSGYQVWLMDVIAIRVVGEGRYIGLCHPISINLSLSSKVHPYVTVKVWCEGGLPLYIELSELWSPQYGCPLTPDPYTDYVDSLMGKVLLLNGLYLTLYKGFPGVITHPKAYVPKAQHHKERLELIKLWKDIEHMVDNHPYRP